ncbi:MAG: hypothetical protein ABFQ65_00175 [Nanoarchaeota archaeon]
MKEFWGKEKIRETARDLIALGGLPFFILVIARVWLISKQYYQFQFIFGGIIFLILMFIFRGELHAGLGLIALVFTTIYYNDLKFGIFASGVYCLLLFSLIYLKEDKRKIFKGILFGGISTLVSYYLVKYLFM